MAYLEQTDPDLIDDILRRKEFITYRSSKIKEKNILTRYSLNEILGNGHVLEPHSYQLFIQHFMNPNTPYTRLLLKWLTGLGKCHKINTPILMFDGNIKKVQDIQVGDFLMGDDSTPRKVLSLTNGFDEMYDIIPAKGEKHTVNKEHILCLKFSDKPIITNNKYNSVVWFEPKNICNRINYFETIEEAKLFYNDKIKLYNQHKNIVEISVKDYIKLNSNVKSYLKLYKVPVEFPNIDLPFDPYVIGFWLGYKSFKYSSIITKDSIVINYLIKILNNSSDNNRFLNTLKKYNLIENKHIPHIYKCNSRENRLKLLAGLIDSYCGSNYNINGVLEFTQKSENLMNDVIYLCQSLGFACYKKIKKTSQIHKGIKKYNFIYKINICGNDMNDVPILIPKKSKKKQIKDVLMNKFKVEYVNNDKFYGFSLDGNSRYLIGDFTVSHNSIASILIGLEFINYYKKAQESGALQLGSVWVVGFTESIYKDDLMKFPELGFITMEEQMQISKLRELANHGNATDIDRLNDMQNMIKRRFGNRQGNGFFKFIGYKALLNRLFLVKDPTIHLVDLSEDEIMKKIKQKIILLNEELISEMSNSLLICDEIHNTYNSAEKNNWGVSLQTILNNDPTIRAVFLSATPINNSPTEIIDLLNLLIPNYQDAPSVAQIEFNNELKLNNNISTLDNNSSDLTHEISKYKSGNFKKSEFFNQYNQLTIQGSEKLKSLLSGRVSYIRNNNPNIFPAKGFIGEKITGIDYLKFIRCPMSKFQADTYKLAMQQSINPGVLSNEAQYIVDFAIPDPAATLPYKHAGLYKTRDIKQKLLGASGSWKAKNQINYDIENDKIYGECLNIDKELYQISNKYYTMIKNIHNILLSDPGKIFIYHNVIHMSGVIFIGELLLNNGFIGETDTSSDNTLCAICGKARKFHNKNQLIKMTENDSSIGGSSSTENYTEINVEINNNAFNFTEEINNLDDIQIVSVLDFNGLKFKYFIIENIKFTPNEIPDECITWAIKNNIIFESQKIIHNAEFIAINSKDYDVIYYILGNNKLNHTNDKAAYLSKLLFKIKKKLSMSSLHSSFDSKSIDNNHIINNHVLLDNYSKVENADNYSKVENVDSILLDNVVNNYSIAGGKLNNKSQSKSQHIQQSTNSKDNHFYIPCRFILIHSHLDQRTILNSIKQFNGIDNLYGEKIMILVGGKIMKESKNLMAVQHLYITHKPDNISTMIQINGRAIRAKSHALLPANKRLVKISIYVSSYETLPGKSTDLTYEELKYREKINIYKEIQKIEKVMHEVAIDKSLNYDIIFQDDSELQKQYSYQLGIIPYKNDKPYVFKNSELNLSTFNAYYAKEEVDRLKYLIKKTFIEISPIWKYSDLLHTIKNTADLEWNSTLISENNFILALDNLLFISPNSQSEHITSRGNKKKYIEPISLLLASTNMSDLHSLLHNPLDKVIHLKNNQNYGIIQIGEYYMMQPINTLSSDIEPDMEVMYRNNYQKSEKKVPIMNYLIYDMNTNYIYKKKKFIEQWEHVDILNLELAICDFGINFHKQFAEECIEYIFRIWTDMQQKKSEYHIFYIKMLYYYDLRKIIIWAHTISDKLFTKYSKWAIQIKQVLKRGLKIDNIDDKYLNSTSGLLNLLKTSINRNNTDWVSSGMVEDYNDNIKKTLAMFDGNSKKSGSIKKISADLLPIGHYIGKIPRFYNPDLGGWYNDISYIEQKQWVENNIIIGYDDKSKTGISVKFKLRNPIQNIKKYSDTRQIEKGSICSTKSKGYLLSIAKKLEIPHKEMSKNNVDDLCLQIRTRLIYLELKARTSNSNIKYFYFLFEMRPEVVSS